METNMRVGVWAFSAAMVAAVAGCGNSGGGGGVDGGACAQGQCAKADPGIALNGIVGGEWLSNLAAAVGAINGRITFDDYRMLDKMVADAAPKVAASFGPAGCATTSVSNLILTLKLTDCTGPLGAGKLSGTLSAAFAPYMTMMASGVAVKYGGNVTLTVGGDVGTVQAEIGASSTYLSAADLARYTLTLESGKVTAATPWREVTLTATGKVTVVTEASCVTTKTAQMGDVVLTVQNIPLMLTITDLKVCKGQCPSGALAAKGPMNSASVTFSGTNAVSYTAGMAAGTVTIPCGM